MGTVDIKCRLDEDVVMAIDSFAEEKCRGNRSEAIRMLIAQGLENESSADALEKKLSEFMDGQYERLAKLTSRGTKAALANLFFLATYLPAISNENIEIKNLLLARAQAEGLLLDETGFDDALAPVDKFTNILPGQIFDYMFSAGGKLQSSKSQPTYKNAERGLHVY